MEGRHLDEKEEKVLVGRPGAATTASPPLRCSSTDGRSALHPRRALGPARGRACRVCRSCRSAVRRFNMALRTSCPACLTARGRWARRIMTPCCSRSLLSLRRRFAPCTLFGRVFAPVGSLCGPALLALLCCSSLAHGRARCTSAALLSCSARQRLAARWCGAARGSRSSSSRAGRAALVLVIIK